uniref:Uncharacterized protein ycf33 n=1 Tax=Anthurium amnicola TaxID=1678845 RepID=A0A1D1YD14_9ARAE
MKYFSAPNFKPACQCHPLFSRQATTLSLHHITIIPSFPNPSSPPPPPAKPSLVAVAVAAAAAGRRAASSPTKALCHRPTTTTGTPPTHQSDPEAELCEAFPTTSSPSTTTTTSTSSSSSEDGYSRRLVVLAAASVGMAAVLMAGVEGKEALALGPEGPLVEEFWDNVRRYGLYVLTVSTGAIYTILEPIAELLKNPITAILILLILGGSFFLLSQVLSFMVGINEFSYDYAT